MAVKPSLVILRALGLGDFLTVVPALRALTRAYPDHERVLMAPASLEPLLPLVTESGMRCLTALSVTNGLEGRLSYQSRTPDIAVNLHGRGPQSHELLCALTPEKLIAFRHGDVRRTAGMPRWSPHEHEVKRWCRLLDANGIRADAAQLAIACPQPGSGACTEGATLLHPGAASGSRRWPPERWSCIARAESAAGRRVVISGSADEAPLARSIARDAGLEDGAVRAGRTDLLELAAVVAAAAVVVCGDTGVAHLATALGVPSVLLFGPTSPRLWGPPANAFHRVLWSGTTGDPHADRPDPGLLQIGTNQVIRALAEIRGCGRVARVRKGG